MNYSEKDIYTNKSVLCCEDEEPFAPQDEPHIYALRGSFTSSLTTYKEVVYNFADNQKVYEQFINNLDKKAYKRTLWQNLTENKLVHYGLTQTT